LVKCSKCTVFVCEHPEKARVTSRLDFCPMNVEKNTLMEASKEYEKPLVRRMATISALVESKGYMKWTRVEDTIEFAKSMNFKRLGVACCVGLMEEGRVLTDILESNDFEVTFVFCKTGGIPKEELGLKDSEKVHPGIFEPICNPVELNIIVGLCVGHDSTFIKYSKAPVTVLIAKDRVLCHNPVGALYTAKGYYKHKLYSMHKTSARARREKKGRESRPATRQ